MPRWTPEAREKQRLLILERKPWLNSTGANTVKGKKRVSQNARKKKLTQEDVVFRSMDASRKKLKKEFNELKHQLSELMKLPSSYI
jgi:hypothetical protein